MAVRATYEGEGWEEAREQIDGADGRLDLPAGYSWSWNDRILEQDDQNAEMGINFLLALVLVYLVMASLFESLAQPFAILFSILFALPGRGLDAGGHRHAVQPDGADRPADPDGHRGQQRHRAARPHQPAPPRGMARDEAILQAGRDRLRPILMTASTTIIGLLPLAVRGSTRRRAVLLPAGADGDGRADVVGRC